MKLPGVLFATWMPKLTDLSERPLAGADLNRRQATFSVRPARCPPLGKTVSGYQTKTYVINRRSTEGHTYVSGTPLIAETAKTGLSATPHSRPRYRRR